MDRSTEGIVADAEAMLARAAEQLARQTRELDIKKRVVALVPRTLPLPVRSVSASGYKCDAGLGFEVTTREEALALMQALPAVPAVLLRQRGGTSSFMPAERFAGPLKTGQTCTAVAPFIFSVDGYGGGYTKEETFWWTRLGELLVKVSAQVRRDRVGTVTIRAARVSDFDTRLKFTYEGMPPAECIYWSPGDKRDPGEVTAYWLLDGGEDAARTKYLQRGQVSRTH